MVQGGTDDDLAARIGAVLARVGVHGDVTSLERLSGGASRETWRLRCGERDLVLQRMRRGASGDMEVEAALLREAAVVDVPVPAVVVSERDPAVLGAPFVVVEAVEGETIARRILREDRYDTARNRLTAQLGEALARLHTIAPTAVPGLAPEDPLTHYRSVLDGLGEPHPAFEIAFRWLESNRPDARALAVVHGDFRLGNVIVGEEGLRAVLDWELAHLGDPLEDLGWLCVKAWRFGGAGRVAGIGAVEDLLAAYASVAGERPDDDTVFWWEVMGTLKWGVICIMQASAHLTGMSRSHELAAIGRRVCENEHDLMEMLGPHLATAPRGRT
jgi:aminoglycoside phosphotransferase (APT) family kinase protein